MATTMNNDTTVRCPKCRHEFPLTEAMLGPLLEQQRTQFAADLDAAKKAIETDLNAKAVTWAAEKAAGKIADANAAAEEAIRKLADARRESADKDEKLAVAQRAQADAITRQTALDARERELDLVVARRVAEGAGAARVEAERVAQAAAALTIAERDDKLRNLTEQIEDLKRRAEQGSQQGQGEAQEIVLEAALKSSFPIDEVSPVAKGQFGGDVVQKVLGTSGAHLGTILWESKRTKNWTQGWLSKLKTDQRAAKAEISVIATQAMPDGVDGFGLVESVWVCEFRYAIPLAVALRQSLIDMAAVRASREGIATKAEEVYEYLTGPHFKQRVAAVAEVIAGQRRDLEAERTAITRIWAKREAQINTAGSQMAAMFGDVQGIAGRAVGEIGGLTLEGVVE